MFIEQVVNLKNSEVKSCNAGLHTGLHMNIVIDSESYFTQLCEVGLSRSAVPKKFEQTP